MRRINIASAQLEYDGSDPEGFRSGMVRLGNETKESARVLMFSTVVVPTATVGIWIGNPDADVIVRKDSAVDYYEGEHLSR